MQLAEDLEMNNSVKYASVNSLLKFFMQNPQFPVSQLDMILLVCLRVGIKVFLFIFSYIAVKPMLKTIVLRH